MAPLSEPQETKAFLKLDLPSEEKLENEPVEPTEDGMFTARATCITSPDGLEMC
jgi:hypothetical protein